MNEDGQRLVQQGRANRFQSNGQATSRRLKYANIVGRVLALRVLFRERVWIICSEDGQRVDYSLSHLLSPECQKPSSTSVNHRTQMIKLEQNCKKPDPKQESLRQHAQ